MRSSYQYVLDLRERLEDTLRIAKDETDKAQKRCKHYYDRSTRPRKFEVGDMALVYYPPIQTGCSRSGVDHTGWRKRLLQMTTK